MTNLKDIAEKAGVNITTVSRALNDSPEIKTDTKNKILKIANELNYQFHRDKKASMSKTNNNIGIICPEVKSDMYGQLVNTIEEHLRAEGYHMLIGLTDFKYDNEAYYLDLFHKREVAGIIFISSVNPQIEEDLKLFKLKCDIPLIQVGAAIKSDVFDFIEIDDGRGVFQAVEHLIRQGHKKIGYIGDSLSKTRLDSFRKMMKSHSLEIENDLIRIGEERFEEGGCLRMNEILSQNKPVTAVFAAYDDMAIGAMRAIYDKGLRIPEDISIVGVDNIRVTGFLYRQLTTVSSPVHEMGKIAVRILISKMTDVENKAIQHVKILPELVLRNTTAAPGHA